MTIEKTNQVNLKNLHVVTRVPGVRRPIGPQAPASLHLTAELENSTASPVAGVLYYTIAGQQVSQKVTLPARTTRQVALPTLALPNPQLWWPNGYGPQHLYPSKFTFLVNGTTVSDEEAVAVGVREIQTQWNPKTQSR